MKNYRLTYALTRESEEIFTTMLNAWDTSHAITLAREYIDKEHGFMTSNTVEGFSILQIKD